mmetsp:Transcript_52221/g.137178  ORF Transcript_52221/g.137178 Transcript_52221/m.137178 type:complete len:278 (+) Transcript_52221:97-930(+)
MVSALSPAASTLAADGVVVSSGGPAPAPFPAEPSAAALKSTGMQARRPARTMSCVTRIASSWLDSSRAPCSGAAAAAEFAAAPPLRAFGTARSEIGVEAREAKMPKQRASETSVLVSKTAKRTVKLHNIPMASSPAIAARTFERNMSILSSRPMQKSRRQTPSSATLSICTSSTTMSTPPGPTTTPPNRKPMMLGTPICAMSAPPTVAAQVRRKRSWMRRRSSARCVRSWDRVRMKASPLLSNSRASDKSAPTPWPRLSEPGPSTMVTAASSEPSSP